MLSEAMESTAVVEFMGDRASTPAEASLSVRRAPGSTELCPDTEPGATTASPAVGPTRRQVLGRGTIEHRGIQLALEPDGDQACARWCAVQ